MQEGFLAALLAGPAQELDNPSAYKRKRARRNLITSR
jgi:hypothetical protein